MVDIQDTQLLKQLPCHQVVTVLADLFEPVFSKSFATTEADHSANGSQDNNAWSRPTKASGKASLSKLPLDTKSDREDEIETDFTGQKFDRSAGSLNETYIKYLEDQLTAEQEKNRDLEERVATQNTDLRKNQQEIDGLRWDIDRYMKNLLDKETPSEPMSTSAESSGCLPLFAFGRS
ncbi:hypothetical protein B0H10DRAFT_1957563 [Mycena sp. CBHHK59/15]|nr:hypothetical protein B0H10DRAFT_1957563 [Mycena sp. CBHHK59/15]